MLISLVTRFNIWALENSIVPTPGGSTAVNEEDVTPGVLGFVITALFAVAVILVGFDMYRRVRRMRYREEVREAIAAELESGTREGDAPTAQ